MEVVIGIPEYNKKKNTASIILKLKEILNTVIVCRDTISAILLYSLFSAVREGNRV